MIPALVALALPVVAAWVWLGALKARPPDASRWVTASVAFCAGVGGASLVTFWWAVITGGLGRWFVMADAGLWTAGALMAWRWSRRNGGRPASVPQPRAGIASGRVLLAAGVFVVLAGIVAAAAAATFAASPHGHPDATLIWNLKARFMAGGGDWRGFVQVPWASPSHPLLVPASVARLWTYAGSAAPAVPVLLAAATALAIAAAVVGALDARRARAWVAAAVVVAPATFSQSIASQTADLPVALLLLVTLLVFEGRERTPPDASAMLLPGALAGLLGWTKNEGLVVVLILAGMTAWRAGRMRQPGPIAGFILGAAPAILAVAWVKLALAPVPPEYLADASASASLDALGDPSRLREVGRLAWDHWRRWGSGPAMGMMPVVTVAAAAAVRVSDTAFARRAVPVVAALFATYVAVWVLSPLDTAWLVSTTADRLLLQLWPTLVVAAFSLSLAGSRKGNLVR